MFWRKGSDRLFRLIMILMLIVDAQCLKDILSFYFTGFDNEENWFLISAADMFIIPFYSFVLMELVKPGWTTWRKAVMLELPFVLLPAIYCVTGNNIYFYILSVWGAVYGLTTFVVMFFLIRRYHRQLKERFSYQENINLNWLLAILSSCFLILIIWTMSCFVINVDFDDLYMVLSLAIWMFICYFVYRHESVIDELTDSDTGPIGDGLDDGNVAQGLAATVRQLFEEEKIYLNPKLKLSDVARMVGTNRTYLSRFFAGLLSLHTNVRLMNIVRKCKYKLIRRIDAMTLQNLRNDSLKSRDVGEDFKKVGYPEEGKPTFLLFMMILKLFFAF